MNSFRDILYAHLEGHAALEQVERVLEESLQQQVSHAPAHGAIIEALYRGERLPGAAYHVLMRCVHSAQRPEGGARPTLLAAVGDVPGASLSGPSRFGVRGPAAVEELSGEALDDDIARRFWEVSEHLTGTAFPLPDHGRP